MNGSKNLPDSRGLGGNIKLHGLSLNGEVYTGLLILVHVILELRLSELIEGNDDESHEDVDKEEWEDDEEHNVEDALLSSVPGNGSLIFIGGRHGVLKNAEQIKFFTRKVLSNFQTASSERV